MKILYISAEPVRSKQASETHVNEIAKELRLAGHDVTTCVTRVMGSYDRTPVWRRCVGYLIFWFKALVLLQHGSVVYARAHPANIFVAVAAWVSRIPIVHEVNGSYTDIAITHPWLSPLMGVIAALQRFQYRKAKALIAVTDQLAAWLREQAPGVPVVTVPNGVNCNVFHYARPAAKATARNYALFFGSLTRWHGIECMIAAVEDVTWPAEIDLVIIGDGQLSELAKQASDRNPRIRTLPSVSQQVLVEYINSAAVGLVPIVSAAGRSNLGLSPLKLYEMLACGLPVVVTDFPGQADLVRSLDAGIVIPPDDPAALAQAVTRLCASPPDPGKMMKVASAISREHNWSTRAATIESVLLHL